MMQLTRADIFLAVRIGSPRAWSGSLELSSRYIQQSSTAPVNWKQKEKYKIALWITQLCPVDSSISTFWAGPFQVEGVPSFFLLLPYFIAI